MSCRSLTLPGVQRSSRSSTPQLFTQVFSSSPFTLSPEVWRCERVVVNNFVRGFPVSGSPLPSHRVEPPCSVDEGGAGFEATQKTRPSTAPTTTKSSKSVNRERRWTAVSPQRACRRPRLPLLLSLTCWETHRGRTSSATQKPPNPRSVRCSSRPLPCLSAFLFSL